MVVIMRTFVMVLCQCDLLVSTETFHAYSQTVPFSESILPTFPRQSFFESVLPTFPSTSFLELILPIFCLLVCLFGRPWGERGGGGLINSSYFWGQPIPLFFSRQSFLFWGSDFPIFLSQASRFLTQSFPFFFE